MDLVLWIVLGAAVGLIAWAALVGIERLPLAGCAEGDVSVELETRVSGSSRACPPASGGRA